MIFEYTSNNWIDRVKDNRKEILNAEKAKDLQRFEANDFGFIEKVCMTLISALRISESEFSKHVLNATKDYYAYLKNTKNKISDDKLENLFENLKVLADGLKNTIEFSNKLVLSFIAVLTNKTAS